MVKKYVVILPEYDPENFNSLVAHFPNQINAFLLPSQDEDSLIDFIQKAIECAASENATYIMVLDVTKFPAKVMRYILSTFAVCEQIELFRFESGRVVEDMGGIQYDNI